MDPGTRESFVAVMARAYYDSSEMAEHVPWGELPAVIRDDKAARMVPVLDALLDRFRLVEN